LAETRRLQIAAIIVLLAAVSYATPNTAYSTSILQSEPILTVEPSSVTIKVGDTASVNVTLTNPQINPGEVCFSVDGFPTSGFIESFNPTCSNPKPFVETLTVMSVEATPAAAPQSFTAFVVATGLNWTVRSPINITVEPAMPAWIPWSIILVFMLVLIIPLFIKAKKKTDPTKRRKSSNR